MLTTSTIDRPGLRQAIEKIVEREAKGGSAIRAITTQLSPYSSSFRIDEIVAEFDSDATVRFLLKDLSWHTMLDGGQRVRNAHGHDPAREIATYRRLLPSAPAGPPRCLAAVSDHETAIHWLFLEWVDGLQLRHIGERSVWESVATWVGRYHTALSRRAGIATAVAVRLPRWNADHYRWTLARVHEHVSKRGNRLQRQSMAVVDRHHDWMTHQLLNSLDTVMHGQMYPANVVVDVATPRPRICVLDWETAAVGPGVVDVAALIEGRWSEEDRLALIEAYLLGRDGIVTTSSLVSVQQEIRCARVHLALEAALLPASVIPSDMTADWLAIAAELSEGLPR
jgi:hypothetical protein